MRKEDLNLKVGQRIRKLRMDKSMSIQDLADAIDIEYNNLIRLEMGRTNPTLWTLYRISRALGTSLSSMMDGIEK